MIRFYAAKPGFDPGRIPAKELTIWAEFALYGRIKGVFPRWTSGQASPDWALWTYTHFEQFWRDKPERKSVLKHFADGKELPYSAYDTLMEFCDWYLHNPIPPMGQEDTEGDEANERQYLAREIGVKDAARMLGTSEQNVRELLERSRILGWKHKNLWVTTVGYVLDYAERKQKRKKVS